jgi:glycosyltransferase involved in cell wall biosynthesis
VNAAIVHVASGREWRGGQRQVWLLARELARRGVDQVVVTGRDTELARRLAESRVPVRGVSWSAGLDPRVLPPLLAQIRSRRPLVHAHDSHALSLAGTGAGLTGAPLIATRRVVFPLRHRGFWGRATRVIAISGAVREALIVGGVPLERITVIPDAVELSLPDSGADVRRTLQLPSSSQVAITLGALTPEKGHSTLLAAAAVLVRDLPGLHWAMVGEGPERRSLERQIADLGLGGRVHLLGALPDPHVALAGADVFVLSSLSEGLGSAVLAAMAAGVPVVATAVGGVTELLAPDRGLLVPPGDAPALGAAVRRVLSDEKLRVQLARAAGEAAREFGVGGMAERVLEVYRSVAHSLGPS